MNTILKLLLTAVAVMLIAKILPGVTVVDFDTSIKVALVLGLLKIVVRPIIIFSTLPVTLVTLGLFLFVINTSLILMTDYFLDGFMVSGFWVALLFSLLLSASQSVLYSFLKKENSIQKRY